MQLKTNSDAKKIMIFFSALIPCFVNPIRDLKICDKILLRISCTNRHWNNIKKLFIRREHSVNLPLSE